MDPKKLPDPVKNQKITVMQTKNLISTKLLLGINQYQNIGMVNEKELENFINRELSKIQKSHLEQLPPGFSLSRKLYREFHIDPTKYRPSSEALWRRLKNKNDFPRVNPFVNLTNLLSLKFQICFGLYDVTKINGNIVITIGNETDQFQGIRKDILHMRGKIVLKDEEGPFGNPSSDSLRTCVEPSTTQILQILFFQKDDPDAAKLTQQAHDTFLQFFRIGEANSYML
jgi:DNA/RNA-binding domain of Phe-tRNA-synthetase-like protein